LRHQYTDEELINLLLQDSERAIELIFEQYYAYICKAVYKMLSDRSVTEDLAQEVFLELWRKRQQLNISTSLKAYLRRAAVNRSLNYIRDQRIKFTDEAQAPPLESNVAGALQRLQAEELQERIDQAIDALPDRCRIVFVLSRFEDMSYNEIAAQLDISSKTVENQISKALRLLRLALAPYLGLFLIGGLF